MSEGFASRLAAAYIANLAWEVGSCPAAGLVGALLRGWCWGTYCSAAVPGCVHLKAEAFCGLGRIGPIHRTGVQGDVLVPWVGARSISKGSSCSRPCQLNLLWLHDQHSAAAQPQVPQRVIFKTKRKKDPGEGRHLCTSTSAPSCSAWRELWFMGQLTGLLGLVSCGTLEFCCACVVFTYKTCLDRCKGHPDGG